MAQFSSLAIFDKYVPGGLRLAADLKTGKIANQLKAMFALAINSSDGSTLFDAGTRCTIRRFNSQAAFANGSSIASAYASSLIPQESFMNQLARANRTGIELRERPSMDNRTVECEFP